jgi:tetraprenyl-beta-curcumene synthase
MTRNLHRRGHAVRDAGVLLSTLGRYWVTIFPTARREIHYWRVRAETIPDPTLRSFARRTLAHEGMNAEGAALFATLAPRALRASVVRLVVCFQVMYDYLDVLTEQPVPDSLSASRRVHRALTTALGQPSPSHGYYTDHVHGDDGGYLDGLIEACRKRLADLPSTAVVAPFALEAARRSADGQSYSHAAVFATNERLMRWATNATPPGLDLQWWETAAASESSLAIHALLASAADPALTPSAAERISAAYWPWITGLNALLDDFVDRAEDAAEGTHSYVANYASDADAAHRVATIAGQATQMVRTLPRSRQHAVILAAMTSFYLSAPQAASPDVRAVAVGVRAELDTDVRVLLAMLRARRLAARV